MFSIPDNDFSGTLPVAFANWTKLTSFNARRNQLVGTLSPQFSTWAGLIGWNIRSNNFHGELPPSFSQWTQLQYFTAGANQFTGTLPDLYSRFGTSITKIDLCDNQLVGTIRRAWAASLTQIDQFAVQNNSLSGTIPTSCFPNARTLALGNNKFIGTVPSMSKLVVLDAQNNTQLYGPLQQKSCGGRGTTVDFCLNAVLQRSNRQAQKRNGRDRQLFVKRRWYSQRNPEDFLCVSKKHGPKDRRPRVSEEAAKNGRK